MHIYEYDRYEKDKIYTASIIFKDVNERMAEIFNIFFQTQHDALLYFV